MGDQFPPADRPVHSMAVKVREDAFGWSLFLAIVVMLTCWVGMAISLSGIADLPKCKYGDPRCYFFVQVCDDMLELGTSQQSCVWMPKQRKTEGATEDGLEQVTVPILASCLGIVPGMVLVVAMIIRNERCLFALIEIGKMFIAFDIILLVVSCMQMDELGTADGGDRNITPTRISARGPSRNTWSALRSSSSPSSCCCVVGLPMQRWSANGWQTRGPGLVVIPLPPMQCR